MAGSTCARLCPVARPVLCPSQIVRNLVVGPRPVTAPAPAGGLPGSRGTPTGGRRRAGGPGPPWSRSGRPSPTPQHRQPGTQRGLDRGPGPIGLPARKPLVDHLPRPIALGQVPPCAPVRTRNRMPFNTWRDPANAIPSGCQSLPAKAPAAPTPRRCRIVASRLASAASPVSDPNSPAIRETRPRRTVVSGPWLQ